MTDASLIEVMTVMLKLEENVQYGFQMQQPFKPFQKFPVQGWMNNVQGISQQQGPMC